ncbi:MAG: SusC/RagA family TonB-linked outer membrane protein, partial [Tannerella sp.]|nr:SusC/RagA family TonB-linked outer membrane protein [Tannerella sp.]
SFGKHNIEALGLFEARWTEDKVTTTSKSEFDFLIPELNYGTSDKTKWGMGGSSSSTAQYGAVARLSYNFDQKYLIELAGRYDAIYKYAPGRRGDFFPSVSLGWRISEESFMASLRDNLDNLKLRASYGKSGNPVGNAYAYMSSYSIGNSYLWGQNGVREQGIYSTVESNPNLTWETVWKTDLGFDLNVWKGLLGLEFDWYHEKRNDKILAPNAQVPVEYGVSLADENAGIDARWGIDITVNNRTEIAKDLSLQNSVVFSFTDHQLIENHENQGTLYNLRRRQTGLASGQIWGYKSAGLFADEEDVRNWAFQDAGTMPGDIKYVDINGDGKIDSEDIVHIGRSRIPQIMWGYNLNVRWKGFDLGVFFQGTGRSNYYLGTADRGVRRPFADGKARIEHSKSWTTDNPNPNAEFPRLRSSNFAMNYAASDFWVINSSYIKLKSVDVGYSFNPELIKKAGMTDLRINANFYNVWTIFSKASKDFDPEVQDFSAYPQQFISTIGLTATF